MHPRPTGAELAILQVLWEHGPATVREVHERLREDKGTGYTTVLKTLQIMADKGLVRRDETRRAHVYQAKIRRGRTQSQIVREVMDRVFAGSASRLVLHALSTKRASAEEIAEIRRTLDEMEGQAE